MGGESVYALHPMIEASLSHHERRIWRLIQERTRENPITVREIAERLKMDRRTVRRIVSQLVTHRQLPIGSSNRPPYGYYVLLDADDYDWEIRKLRNEAMACLRRMATIKRVALREIVRQLYLEVF